LAVVKKTLASSQRLHVQQLAHPLDKPFHLERLVHEVVGTGRPKFRNLVFLYHSGDANYPDIIEGGIAPDPLAHLLPVDVREHNVQHDDVWAVFLDHHPGIEAVVHTADFKAAVLFQHIRNQFDQFLIVVHDQDLPLSAFQGIRGDAVIPHESIKLIAGDAAEAASGHPESFQLAGIEAPDDRLLTYLADLCCFASGKNGLVSPLFLRVPFSCHGRVFAVSMQPRWGVGPPTTFAHLFPGNTTLATRGSLGTRHEQPKPPGHSGSSGSADITEFADCPDYNYFSSPVNTSLEIPKSCEKSPPRKMLALNPFPVICPSFQNFR